MNALPGFHAFSGSDYTASFMNKGKVTPLDLFQKQEAFCEAFAQLGEKDSVNEDVVLSVEAFVCTMYGKTKMKNVDEVRHAMFQQHYAPKNDKDPLQKIKGINPSSMPPCHQVLMNKIKRANYVAALWKSATKQTPSTFSPNGNGWELKDGSYHIKWHDGDQLPHSICDMLQNDEEADDDDDDTEVTNVYDSDDSEESDGECL